MRGWQHRTGSSTALAAPHWLRLFVWHGSMLTPLAVGQEERELVVEYQRAATTEVATKLERLGLEAEEALTPPYSLEPLPLPEPLLAAAAEASRISDPTVKQCCRRLARLATQINRVGAEREAERSRLDVLIELTTADRGDGAWRHAKDVEAALDRTGSPEFQLPLARERSAGPPLARRPALRPSARFG